MYPEFYEMVIAGNETVIDKKVDEDTGSEFVRQYFLAHMTSSIFGNSLSTYPDDGENSHEEKDFSPKYQHIILFRFITSCIGGRSD